MTTLHSVINDATAGLDFNDPPLCVLRESFTAFYSRHGIMVSTIEDAVSYVYKNEVSQSHDIYELDANSFLILPAILSFPKDVLLKTIKERRESEPDLGGEGFRIFMSNTTAGAKAVHQHLQGLRNSRRKFTVLKPLPDFPEFAELKEFHECKRKNAYINEPEASAKLQAGQCSYQCGYCSLWHNGHPPLRDGIALDAMEKRYKRTWRRYKNI